MSALLTRGYGTVMGLVYVTPANPTSERASSSTVRSSII